VDPPVSVEVDGAAALWFRSLLDDQIHLPASDENTVSHLADQRQAQRTAVVPPGSIEISAVEFHLRYACWGKRGDRFHFTPSARWHMTEEVHQRATQRAGSLRTNENMIAMRDRPPQRCEMGFERCRESNAGRSAKPRAADRWTGSLDENRLGFVSSLSAFHKNREPFFQGILCRHARVESFF